MRAIWASRPTKRAMAGAQADPTRRRRAPVRGGRRLPWILLAGLLAVSVTFAEPAAAASDSNLGAKVFDAAVLRPLNGAALVLGTVFFAISAPLVAPGGNIATSWDVFVVAPYEYTVQRPLGDF